VRRPNARSIAGSFAWSSLCRRTVWGWEAIGFVSAQHGLSRLLLNNTEARPSQRPSQQSGYSLTHLLDINLIRTLGRYVEQLSSFFDSVLLADSLNSAKMLGATKDYMDAPLIHIIRQKMHYR
jgi:hypothetical protein